jgi:UPF0716 protein FxsA
MFPYILALFIILPVIEFWLLFKVASIMGFWSTLFLVISTGVIGASLARAQGVMVMMQIQRDLAEGRMPAPRMIDGVMILIAGAFLITPGLITDTAGFLLLVPPVRALIRNWLRLRFEQKLHDGTIDVESNFLP